MKDPLEQNQVGVALFGTMWEDLGIDGVKALINVNGEMSKTKGTMNEIANTGYDNILDSVKELGRTLMSDVLLPLGQMLSPVVQTITDFIKFFVSNGGIILSLATGIGLALLTWNISSIVGKLVDVVLRCKDAVLLFNETLMANPIMAIVSVITLLIGTFITLMVTNEDFRNKVIEIWNSICEAASNIWGEIVSFFTETIPEAFNSFIEFIKGNWQGLLLLLVNPFVGGFKLLYDNCEGFREFINNFIQGVKDGFISGWEAVVTFFTETIPSWFINLWTSIKQVCSDGWNAIVEFFTQTIPAWLQSVGEWFLQLPEKIGYALGLAIGMVAKWGIDLFTWVTTEVPKIIDGIITWFMELPGKVWIWLVNTWNKFKEWALNMQTAAYEGMMKVIDAVINWFKQLPGKVWEWLTATWDKFKAWCSNMKQSASDGISKVIDAIVNWFKQLPGKIYEWIMQALNKVKEWCSNLISTAKSEIPKFIDSVITFFKELPGKIFEVGKNIVKGLWEGIKSMGGWIGDMVSDFVDGLVSGAKESLDIHSPSRVMRDEVGKYMAQGIGVGFVDELKGVNSMIKKGLESTVQTSSNIANNSNGNQPMANKSGDTKIYVTINSPTPVSPYETSRQLRNELIKLGLQF